MNNFWKEIYRPKGQFTQQMLPVMNEITREEWNRILLDLSHKSAPGPSGISYRIIKKLPNEFNELIVALINCCFSFSIMPTQWKASHIIPIPKPQKFAYDITNTRPIALLDTFRKVFTKIMTQRLGGLLKAHSVLKGLNFCGLKGEGTSTPLHIINGLLEDAKEQKKEL